MQPSPWLLSKWGSYEDASEEVQQQEVKEREEEEKKLEAVGGVRKQVEGIMSTQEGEQCTLGGPWLIGAANARRLPLAREQTEPTELSEGDSFLSSFLYH